MGGCESAEQPRNKKRPQNSAGTQKIPHRPSFTKDELSQRLECSKSTETLNIGGVTLRYAFATKRGYYPEELDKENQDAYCIHPNFDGNAFFGVFDGHGKEGHICARFARDDMPKRILTKLKSLESRTPESYKSILTQSHIETNQTLLADISVDTTLSGTTAISVLMDGSTIYVSNVGDSRAIVGSYNENKKLVARAISSDQTPYRRDERERVKQCGARVMTMDQLEGIKPLTDHWEWNQDEQQMDDGGDPPRIWNQAGNFPGAAFIRSIGDKYADELGVIAEPEILQREITSSDQYVVIASDGVFEFFSNQKVIDMITTHLNPLDACKHIVDEAYRTWLKREVRTDDITIIILVIDSVVPFQAEIKGEEAEIKREGENLNEH